jgi:hypothetical protein
VCDTSKIPTYHTAAALIRTLLHSNNGRARTWSSLNTLTGTALRTASRMVSVANTGTPTGGDHKMALLALQGLDDPFAPHNALRMFHFFSAGRHDDTTGSHGNLVTAPLFDQISNKSACSPAFFTLVSITPTFQQIAVHISSCAEDCMCLFDSSFWLAEFGRLDMFGVQVLASERQVFILGTFE